MIQKVLIAMSISIATVFSMSIQSQDLSAWDNKLKEILQMNGSTDEGWEGSHGSLTETGDRYHSLTYPKVVEISGGSNGAGVIRYPYDCRVRKKHYVAQIETGTRDDQRPAMITAKYAYTFSGQVLISDIGWEGHQDRRCGNSIKARLSKTNGAQVKP